MIFASFPLAAAEGVVLAHSHRLPGRVLKKGFVLDAEALEALRAAGHDAVIGARFEADDVAENPAAERLAVALTGKALSRGRAGTGRVNIHADSAGLFVVDSLRLATINGIDESLTTATLADQTAVAAGDMVATIKIIPFAVPAHLLGQAEARIAADGQPFTLHPFRRRIVGLVLSQLPGLKESVIAGTIAATEARVAGLGGQLLPPRTCEIGRAHV